MEQDNRENVRLAYLALCLKGDDVTPVSLVKETLMVANATKDNSIAMLVQEAVRIRAKVVSIEYEDSSKRYLVEYVASNSDSGKTETIRSERTDGVHGKVVRQIWEGISRGDEVIVFKRNEFANDNGKGLASGYRVAPWVTRIRKGGM